MSDFKYEMIRRIALLSESARGWRKEISIVNWNERGPKLDTREWSPNYDRMSRGLTLSRDEALRLKEALNDLELEELNLAQNG